MSMTVDSFLSYWNGIYCDYDGAYGDQCFDLANAYSRWIGGQRFTGATADLIINQAGTFYTRIDNTPSNSPQKGDIMVWNWPHVGIATGNNTDKNGFDCLEQNDPTNSNCHIKHYNYNGVLGWLRPNSVAVDLQSQLDQTRADRDRNWNLYQQDETKIGILNTQVTGLQNDKQNLQNDKQNLQQQLDACKAQTPVVVPPTPPTPLPANPGTNPGPSTTTTTTPTVPPVITPVNPCATQNALIASLLADRVATNAIASKFHWFYQSDFKKITDLSK